MNNYGKNRILYILLLVISLLGTSQISAAPRDVLRNKLTFYYAANPNTATRQVQVLNNSNETGAFWQNRNIAGLHKLVRALLRDSNNGGDSILQYYAAKVIGINNKGVAVYLLDDQSQTLNQSSRNTYYACLNKIGTTNTYRAWPCASGFSQTSSLSGRMALGANYFHSIATGSPSQNLLKSKFGTFIHELMHTQDYTDVRAHLYWWNGKFRGYGMDRNHYGVEVIPNMANTFGEGIANAIRLMYDSASETKFFDKWFAVNELAYVEKTTPPAGAGVSPNMWLYRQLRAAGVQEFVYPQARINSLPAARRAKLQAFLNNYALYRIRNLPARFIIKNEYILAMILAKYMQHVDPNRFYTGIRSVNASLGRITSRAGMSGSGIAVLFEELCEIGLPSGQTLQSVSGQSISGRKTYLLPLAFADYFTAYRSTTKSQFKALFENSMPNGWIDLYWDGYKDTVRQAVSMSGTRVPQQSDLTSIATALGVTQSIPD